MTFSVQSVMRVDVEIGCQTVSFCPYPDYIEVSQRDTDSDYGDGTDLGKMPLDETIKFIDALKALEASRVEIKNGSKTLPKSGRGFKISTGFSVDFGNSEYTYYFRLDSEGNIELEDEDVRSETHTLESAQPLVQALEAAVALAQSSNTSQVMDTSIRIIVENMGGYWEARFGTDRTTEVSRSDKGTAISALIREHGAAAGIVVIEK